MEDENFGNVRKVRKNKPVRRAGMNRRVSKEIRIFYSNTQGFTGKKSSIQNILQATESDICLLTETMTTNVKLDGMKCVTATKSVGQNVAIILGGSVSGIVPMKLYEPNESINPLGSRVAKKQQNFRTL